jgi:hypothetical protein
MTFAEDRGVTPSASPTPLEMFDRNYPRQSGRNSSVRMEVGRSSSHHRSQIAITADSPLARGRVMLRPCVPNATSPVLDTTNMFFRTLRRIDIRNSLLSANLGALSFLIAVNPFNHSCNEDSTSGLASCSQARQRPVRWAASDLAERQCDRGCCSA